MTETPKRAPLKDFNQANQLAAKTRLLIILSAYLTAISKTT